MGSDCMVGIDGGLINIRVGAIIKKGDRFLMVGNEKHDYLYSVGGRIKFGETAEQAVKREVLEETGVDMEIERLGFIEENFFYGDDKVKGNRLVYEISFFFYMKTPENFEPVCKSLTEDNSKEKTVWVTADSDVKMFPEFFRTELKTKSDGVKHIVTDQRTMQQSTEDLAL